MICNIHSRAFVEDLPAKFEIGQLVCHRRYGYRGVVVEVDARCKAEESWYWSNKTQPSQNQPWYHVLVDGSNVTTYPAQESLIPDTSGKPVTHPLVNDFFSGFQNGRYISKDDPWTLV